MRYEVILTAEAEEFLRKCDNSVKRRITNGLYRLEKEHELGKPLTAVLRGMRSLRIGNYRAICQMKDNKLVVLVVKIGHRRNVFT